MAIFAGTVAFVGAVCNALVRNTLIALPLSIACWYVPWWFFSVRSDAFWLISAVMVAPIFIGVSIIMAMLGRAAYRALDNESDDQNP